jgi:tetratricopeptide (TPR) repeat protein
MSGGTGSPGAPITVRRPRLILSVVASGILLIGGVLAVEGWASWQESSARQALDDDRLDDAQRHINLALRVRQGWISTNLQAARIARLRGAYSEAEQYLGRCGQLDGMSEPLQLEWLLLRCQRGAVDELAPSLLALVDRRHPQSAAILEALSAAYLQQTRYPEALRCLDRWMELSPDSVRALDRRGWVHSQLGHREQAISDYEGVLDRQPGRALDRLRLAELFIDTSRPEEALPHLEWLRQRQPGDPNVEVALARCRIEQSRLDEARSLLDGVLAAHPDHFEALLQRGKLELDDGHFAEAEHWLRMALARVPQDLEARYSLYLSLRGQSNRQTEAQEELARWKQDRQDRNRLTHLLHGELDRQPNNADLAYEAGVLFLRLGEDQHGLFWLQRALTVDPRNVRSHRALAAYYERTHNPTKAAEHRQRIKEDR